MIRPLACLSLLAGIGAAFAATMPPVSMNVVDAEDGRPVSGTFVLFRARAHEGTITGHGGKGALLFAAEAVTNDAGELQIAKQEFSTQPFFLNTVLENPQMTLFKPGYATETLTNSRRIIAERQDVTSWLYDGQTVRLKRARTDAELAQAAYWAAEYARHGVDPGNCSWKRIPRFLVAADRAAAEWERKRATLTDDLRFRSVRSPLQDILTNDELFARYGCGSPKAFFEPYLR
jgi:hypothetical protein